MENQNSPETTKSKRQGKRRRWPRPDFETQLAQLGYWCRSVQKAVKKWSPIIGEHFCQYYMLDCAFSVRVGSEAIDVELKTWGHISYVLEVLAALHRIHNDAESIERWVLELGTSGHEYVCNLPALPGYKELLSTARQRGGFRTWKPTENAIAQCARRMRLT